MKLFHFSPFSNLIKNFSSLQVLTNYNKSEQQNLRNIYNQMNFLCFNDDMHSSWDTIHKFVIWSTLHQIPQCGVWTRALMARRRLMENLINSLNHDLEILYAVLNTEYWRYWTFPFIVWNFSEHEKLLFVFHFTWKEIPDFQHAPRLWPRSMSSHFIFHDICYFCGFHNPVLGQVTQETSCSSCLSKRSYSDCAWIKVRLLCGTFEVKGHED